MVGEAFKKAIKSNKIWLVAALTSYNLTNIYLIHNGDDNSYKSHFPKVKTGILNELLQSGFIWRNQTLLERT